MPKGKDQLQKLYKFLGQLSRREKLIMYWSVIVLLLTVVDRLIISPLASKMKSLDRTIESQERRIKQSLHIVTQKEKIMKGRHEYASYLSDSKSDEEEISNLLKEIETIGNKASIYLIDLKPMDPKDMGGSRKYTLNLNCEAQMDQLIAFMYDIENSAKLLTIEKYQINPKSKESSIARCSMTISKIGVP